MQEDVERIERLFAKGATKVKYYGEIIEKESNGWYTVGTKTYQGLREAIRVILLSDFAEANKE